MTVPAFLTYCSADRGLSPRTISSYRGILTRADTPPLAGWTLDDADAWWTSRRGLAPGSRQTELSALRSYFKWLTLWDHRPDDPTRRIIAPKQPQTIPHPVSRTDLWRLLTACDDRGLPDMRRAIALGAYAGLRVSEAAAVDWADVDPEARRLIVRHGKGDKQRLVGFSPVLMDELLPNGGGNIVRAGQPAYSAAALQRRVNRLFTSVGVDHTYHDLRKRWATLAIAHTHDVHAVAKAAGWSSIETANTYAAASDESLDAIAAAVV